MEGQEEKKSSLLSFFCKLLSDSLIYQIMGKIITCSPISVLLVGSAVDLKMFPANKITIF